VVGLGVSRSTLGASDASVTRVSDVGSLKLLP
jgi:hypothetical protein